MKLVRLTRATSSTSPFGEVIAINPAKIESLVDLQEDGSRICFGGEYYLNVQEDFDYACRLVDAAMKEEHDHGG